MKKRKELKEFRTANSKQFLNSDGTIQIELYKNPIHYLKDIDIYEEIDSILGKKIDVLENKKNDFIVEVDEKNTNNLISIESNGKKLIMSPKNINVSNINSTTKYNEQLMKGEKIKFEKIINNSDIEYEIKGKKLKESIIIPKKPNTNVFSFIIKTDLQLTLKQDNRIELLDKGKIIYIIDKPYMMDKKGETSYNIIYQINKKEKEYELDLFIDEEWLKSNDRIFPVTIDPTISINEANDSVIDACIYEGDQDINFNNLDYLEVGKDSDNKTYRSLLKFNLPEIPPGYKIIRATLKLLSYPDEYALLYPNNPIIAVHRITQDWNENTAKWNNMNNQYSPEIEDFFISSRTDPNPSDWTYSVNTADITRLVKDWYNGAVPNYGIMLKQHKEEILEDGKPAFFISKDNSINGLKPVIELNYKNYNGIESYLSYSAQEHFLGQSYISNYTGNLTATFNLVDTKGGHLPASLYFVYNSNDAVQSKNYGYGFGMKPNLFQFIEETSLENFPLAYTDEDGTIHYFYESAENIYYDDEGLGLKIYSINNDYILSDKNGTKYKFVKHTTDYYLEEIINSNSNKIRILYNDNNLIQKVIDSNDSEINITYNQNTIICECPYKTAIINLNNNLITNITCLGDTVTISYTEHNLIEYINNPDGTSLKYEYINDLSNKIFKIIELGRNNTEGNYLEFSYNLSDTKIKDKSGSTNTYIFNESGNVIGITNLETENNLNTAYGKSYLYGEDYSNTNKPIEDKSLVKYVNNVINDSSFERENDAFSCSESITKTYTNDCRTGIKAIKFTVDNTNTNNIEPKIYHTFNLGWAEEPVTLSFYAKGSGNANLMLYSGSTVSRVDKSIELSDEFKRFSITFDMGQLISPRLNLEINDISFDEMIIDDIQLEVGELANYYNLVENSNFANGTENWTIELSNTNDVSAEVEMIGETTALKIHSDPNETVCISKTFDISGEEGDTYNLSFWYKNNGINPSGYIGLGVNSIWATVFFYYEDEEDGTCVPMTGLNVGNDNWQFFSENFTASKKYTKIELQVNSLNNANDCWLTNFSLFKDLEKISYEYDENGNLISCTNLNNDTGIKKYNSDNQLFLTRTPMGEKIVYEYDKEHSDRLLRIMSSSGITIENLYDEDGNVIKNKLYNKKVFDEITSGNTYYIRSKGNSKYFYINADKTIRMKNSECSDSKFNIIKISENEIKFQHSILTEYYIKDINGILMLSYGDNNNIFELNTAIDGTHSFNSKISGKYITVNETYNLVLEDYLNNDLNQQFYLEFASEKLFIDSNATYSIDGKFITSETNQLGNITSYNIDNTTGKINSIIDSNSNQISYTYDEKMRLEKVEKANHVVSYVYDENNNISKIIHGSKEYQLNYDDFNNISCIKLNDNVLINNTYNLLSGKLLNAKYGNNHEINYEYDRYNRINKIIKMNDEYSYYYDNLGRLVKVLSLKNFYLYEYDLAKRLSSHNHNGFITNYEYDKDNNIIEKQDKLINNNYILNYQYNADGAISKLCFGEDEIDFNYDSLGRLKKYTIGDIHEVVYKYLSQGNKTSTLINKCINRGVVTDYEYDNSGNIIKKYIDSQIVKEYEYDRYNQLTYEKDYTNNYYVVYNYDNLGNLLSDSKYTLEDELISESIYSYSNNEWQDQLTKFNNENISYDQIGNVLTFGIKNFNWANGRELIQYTDEDFVISYEYNQDGVRTSKIVNGQAINYFLEGNNIVFEYKSGNMIYYIYNEDNLVGFVYNGNTYYYNKNIKDDIIGIINSSGVEIVQYSYDSWGNITSVVDNSEINLSNINPFRYRSYYYDEETKLYYINSRYYSSQLKRFINIDNGVSKSKQIIDNNLYCYVNNNPINFKDDNGEIIDWAIVAGIAGFIAGYSVGKNAKKKEKQAQKEIKDVQKSNDLKKPKVCLTSNVGFRSDLINNAKEVEKSIGTIKDPLKKLIEFKNVVNNGAKYDLKEQPEYKDREIYYEGMWMEAQDLGNYHYGYIGRAAGFPTLVLVGGAGYNQLSSWGMATIDNCLTASFCDDPRDTYFIKMGAEAYDREH